MAVFVSAEHQRSPILRRLTNDERRNQFAVTEDSNIHANLISSFLISLAAVKIDLLWVKCSFFLRGESINLIVN
jgi:hypothetical protein